ncbi:MAG: electron transport complex subunit RsxC [Spirochaetia bacterium]
MIGHKTFPKGGIHPYERKELTHHLSLWNAIIPSECIVPLQQHIGSPAKAVVAPGDSVREEMMIGESTGFVSVPVHSPIPGVVKEIRPVYLPNGIKSDAVVIQLEGEFDRIGKVTESKEWENLTSEKLLSIAADKGLVGMGGATFPLHVKYKIPPDVDLEYLFLNGAECEPYLSADHRLMLERTKEVITGLRIAERILKPENVGIALEDNKPDVIRKFRELIKEENLQYTVYPLKTKYPQGDEKQIIKSITGREIPSGSLPLEVGAVVSNVGTLFALYEAVVLDKPLVERAVTVSGGAIKNPANFKARIGTPISNLIEECGGFTSLPEKIVVGGPMMGFTIYDLDTPVTKGTSGILALTKKEVKDSKRTNCIQCGRCARVCPMGLVPTRLYKLIDHDEVKQALEEGLMDCRECGCCGYECPAHIPLVQGMKIGKKLGRKRK